MTFVVLIIVLYGVNTLVFILLCTNNNRLMSMGRNGVEYVQTDAEVIHALENIPLDKSSSFLTYPHYSVIEEQKGYANRKQ